MPSASPLITPFAAPIVATEVLVLLHVPPVAPVVVTFSVVMTVLPARQAEAEPVITGTAFTVIAKSCGQPATVYSTVMEPGVPPVTLPDPSTLAVPVPGTTLQVPPVVTSVKEVTNPEHTLLTPLMGAAPFTVTVVVASGLQPLV